MVFREINLISFLNMFIYLTDSLKVIKINISLKVYDFDASTAGK